MYLFATSSHVLLLCPVLVVTRLLAEGDDGVVGVELVHLLSDDHRSINVGNSDEGEGNSDLSDLVLGGRSVAGSGGRDVTAVLAGMTLGNGLLDLLAELGGLGASGGLGAPGMREEDKLGLVELQALHVGVQGTLVSVGATEINGNTSLAGAVLGETSGAELLEGETTTEARATIVHVGGALNDGAEVTRHRAGEHTGGLDAAVSGTAGSASRLVEPGLHASGPILVQVDVGDGVVVLDHLVLSVISIIQADSAASRDSIRQYARHKIKATKHRSEPALLRISGQNVPKSSHYIANDQYRDTISPATKPRRSGKQT